MEIPPDPAERFVLQQNCVQAFAQTVVQTLIRTVTRVDSQKKKGVFLSLFIIGDAKQR